MPKHPAPRGKAYGTLHDQFCSYLRNQGYVEDQNARTGKYTVFYYPSRQAQRNEHQRINYYVGRSGAVRCGRTVAQARPVSDSFKAKMLAEGCWLRTLKRF